MIGGKAPSLYLKQLQEHSQVQLSDSAMDGILGSQAIDARLLRADDFSGFYDARKTAILGVIEKAMGKEVVSGNETAVDDFYESDEE